MARYYRGRFRRGRRRFLNSTERLHIPRTPRMRLAARAARSVSRRAYRGALRMSKRKLARVYATKCGQVAWRATKTLGPRAARWGRNRRRFRRRRFRSRSMFGF